MYTGPMQHGNKKGNGLSSKSGAAFLQITEGREIVAKVKKKQREGIVESYLRWSRS